MNFLYIFWYGLGLGIFILFFTNYSCKAIRLLFVHEVGNDKENYDN